MKRNYSTREFVSSFYYLCNAATKTVANRTRNGYTSRMFKAMSFSNRDFHPYDDVDMAQLDYAVTFLKKAMSAFRAEAIETDLFVSILRAQGKWRFSSLKEEFSANTDERAAARELVRQNELAFKHADTLQKVIDRSDTVLGESREEDVQYYLKRFIEDNLFKLPSWWPMPDLEP